MKREPQPLCGRCSCEDAVRSARDFYLFAWRLAQEIYGSWKTQKDKAKAVIAEFKSHRQRERERVKFKNQICVYGGALRLRRRGVRIAVAAVFSHRKTVSFFSSEVEGVAIMPNIEICDETISGARVDRESR